MTIFDWVMLLSGTIGIAYGLMAQSYSRGYKAAENIYEPLIAKVFENYKALKDAK